MARYAITKNPLVAPETTKFFTDSGEISILNWMTENHHLIDDLEGELTCIYRNKPVEPDELGNIFPDDDDLIIITPVIGEATTIFIVVAIIISLVSLYMSLTIDIPSTDIGDDAARSYSLSGKNNQRKLGSPIERHYGKVKVYPTYASRPYWQFIDDEQVLYQLFCLGHGSPSSYSIFIDDTPVENYSEIEYEVGQNVTLFPDNVVTSSEVNNIEMKGYNTPEYPSPYGWYGGFIANEAGTNALKIEVDIVFPQGLFRTTSKGKTDTLLASFEGEYREVDSNGDPIGSWTNFLTQSLTLKSKKPIRRTYSSTVSGSRIEVRMRRTDFEESASNRIDKMFWAALRAFMPSTQDYGNVTMLAMKSTASSNLNDDTKNKVNVIGTWGDRSIEYAFKDIFTASYGANLPLSYLDLDGIAEASAIMQAAGRKFDWTFDNRTSVWEAAKTIARAGRAVPVMNGTRISMKVDAATNVVNHMFTPRNIIKKSFSRNLVLSKPENHTGIEIEYTDPDTFLPEQVECLVSGDTNNNLKKIILSGVSDRAIAYREGLYIRATEVFQRETVKFKTGLEGRSVKYGDLIGIQHDNTEYAISGYIENINGTEVTLSEDVEFEAGKTYHLAVRTIEGAATIYVVTKGSQPNIVIANTTVDTSYPVNPYVDQQLFSFGEAGTELLFWRVITTKQTGEDITEITAINYDSTVYTYDTGNPPPLDKGSLPPVLNTLPEVTGLNVVPSTGFERTRATITYQLSLGANAYAIQTSPDNTNWSETITTTTNLYEIPVEEELLYVRVAAISDNGQGAWANWNGTLGVPAFEPYDPENFRLLTPFTSKKVDFVWDGNDAADSYQVTVFALPDPIGDPVGTQIFQEDVTQAAYSFNNTEVAGETTPVRDYRLELRAENLHGFNENTQTLTINNPKPAVTSGFYASVISENASEIQVQFTWDYSIDQDIASYRIWASDTTGFTPSETNRIYNGVTNQFTTVIQKENGAIPNYYFRLATIDVWGDDYSPTDEQDLSDFLDVLAVNASGDTLAVNASGDTLQL